MMLRKKLKLDPIEINSKISTYDINHAIDTNSKTESNAKNSLAEKFLELEVTLNESLKKLKFNAPVVYVYHPLDYAYKPHSTFIHKYCDGPKKILFVGMNPGPWGMCQTGIPFGEINIVKDWFKINEEVLKPEKECPDREVVGMNCTRSEVSGQRIWGLFKNLCGTPENFFKSAFMYNYCPIAMMKSNGNNVTPSEIKGTVQRELVQMCDQTLFNIIQLLKIEIVVGVGRFSQERALETLAKNGCNDMTVHYLLHPSPRIPKNQNWVSEAEKKLNELQLLSYFKN